MTRTKGAPVEADQSSEASLDVGACCLCHCALDYSDRAAFYEDDRCVDYSNKDDDNEEDDSMDEYFFRKTDPYLPQELYDPHNALVYCDSCPRLYHQKCHFVPLLFVPRGKWECLICTTRKEKLPVTTTSVVHNARKNQRQASATTSLAATKLDWDRIFTSPPQYDDNDGSIAEQQSIFENMTSTRKAHLWKTELGKKLIQAIQSQLASFRQATSSLSALTTTSRNRKYFLQNLATASYGRLQELAQCLYKWTGSKYRLQGLVQNLHSIIVDDDSKHEQRILDFCQKCNNPEFVQRVIFPFGAQFYKSSSHHTSNHKQHNHINYRRIIPRTAEKNNNNDDDDRDDDSGISLDDITCCICLQSHSTDDNDLILCDGKGCCRAYHMQCVYPAVTPAEVASDREDEDWFCPLCSALANSMILIQSETMGDDWEEERYLQYLSKGRTVPDDSSLKSWESISQVFPEAQWEFETAALLKDGIQNADTTRLLQIVLDADVAEEDVLRNTVVLVGGGNQEDIDDDDDDDEHFDLEAFEAEKEKERNHDDDDDSRSSRATLVEMSSVEYKISKDELNALSSEEGDDDDDENSDGSTKSLNKNDGTDANSRRRSRRLKHRTGNATTSTNGADPGKLDKSNIVKGKRNRKSVDYCKLNDAIFGDLPESELANIDDTDDFEIDLKKKRGSTATSSGSASSSMSSADSDSDSSSSSSEDNSKDVVKKSKVKNVVVNKPNGPRNGRKATNGDKVAAAKQSANQTKTSKNKAKSQSTSSSGSGKQAVSKGKKKTAAAVKTAKRVEVKGSSKQHGGGETSRKRKRESPKAEHEHPKRGNPSRPGRKSKV